MQISFDPRDLSGMSQEQYDSLLHLMKVFRAGEPKLFAEERDQIRLTMEDKNSVVERMMSYAMGASHLTEDFDIVTLYEGSVKDHWDKLHPSDRKVIGRLFRKAVNEYEVSDSDTHAVMYHGATQQNQSLYIRVPLSEKVK